MGTGQPLAADFWKLLCPSLSSSKESLPSVTDFFTGGVGLGNEVVKHAANHVFSGKVLCRTGLLLLPWTGHGSRPGGRGTTSVSLPRVLLDHPFPTFSSPWAPLPAVAQLGESSHQLITWVGAPPRPLPGPAEAQKPLGEISFADRAKNNRFRAFLFFGVVYF